MKIKPRPSRYRKAILVIIPLATIPLMYLLIARGHHHKQTGAATTQPTITSSQTQKSGDSPQTSKQSGSSETEAKQQSDTDPYVGWQTATSKMAGYSFRYPANWKYRSGTDNGGGEGLYVTGPNNFELRFYSHNYTGSQPPYTNCSSECLSVNEKETISIPKYGNVLLEYTTAGVGGGTTNELIVSNPDGSLQLISPLASHAWTNISGLFQGLSESQRTTMTPSDFMSKEDTKTAAAIVKSFSY